MKIRVSCPHPDCSQSYGVETTRLGQAIVCGRCGRQFTLSDTASSSSPNGFENQLGQDASDEDVASLDPDTPKKLGRFEIRDRLGAGAFGSVYRAYDLVLEREVALKVPHAAALEHPQARARFLREPKAAAQLQHPHIVPSAAESRWAICWWRWPICAIGSNG